MFEKLKELKDKKSKFSGSSSRSLGNNKGKHDNADKQLGTTSKEVKVNNITNGIEHDKHELKEKSKRLKHIEDENADLKIKLKDSEDSLNTMKNELESLKNKFEKFQQEQESKIKELQNERNSFESKYQDLNQEKERLQSNQSNRNELEQQLKNENSSLKQKNEELELQKNKFENFQREQESKIKELQNDSQKLLDERNSFESKYQDLKQEKERLQSNRNELEQQLKNEESSLKQKNEELELQKNKFENLQREQESKIKELQNDIHKLLDERNSFESKYQYLKQEKERSESHHNELEQRLKEEIRSLKQKNDELESQKNKFENKSKQQESKIKELLLYETSFEKIENDKQKLLSERKTFEIKYQNLKQEKECVESNRNELELQLKEKKSQIRSLKQKNDELENEASKYQSALGIATDFNLSDNVKFNKDILELHDTLENYVTNLKPKIDVNVSKAKDLLIKYGCRTKISDKEPNKPLIKAVLQRHVLEEILKQAKFYFTKYTQSNKEHHLESRIVSQTTALTDLMENFYKNRLGDDEITRLVSVRLRQQAFIALGTRGFNDIKKSYSESFKHDFIYNISKKINKMMNEYRTIKDTEKRKYVNGLAEDLVRNVVRIFYFRLLIQEPKAQYSWFENGEKINKSSMKGSWNEDEIKDLVVEICSFPLICKQSYDDFKVFTPAKVFPRHFVKQSLGEKVVDFAADTIRKYSKYIYPNDDDDLAIDEYDSEQASLTDSDESNYTETVNERL